MIDPLDITKLIEDIARMLVEPIVHYVNVHPYETVIYLCGFATCGALVAAYNLLKARLGRRGWF